MQEKNNNLPRICFLVDCFITGGVEQVIIQAAKTLYTSFDITLYVYTGVIDEKIIEEIGAYATVKLGTGRLDTKSLIKLSVPHVGRRVIEKIIVQKFDCVVVCKAALNCAVFSNISTKFIYWNHSDKDVIYADNKKLNLLRKFNKVGLTYIYNHYDLVLSVTPMVNDSISKAFCLSNSAVLVNPLNCQTIVKKAKETPKININWRKTTIVVVGRLSEEKGVSRFIRGLSHIGNKEYQALIIGDGNQRSELECLVHELELDNYVYFLGTQENPYYFIKNADLLVSPSKTESFGLTILEAMLLKTPVLASNTVGASFILNDGVYGRIVRDDTELRESLHDFAEKPEIFRNYIEPAYCHASTFDIQQFQKKILEFVNHVFD